MRTSRWAAPVAACRTCHTAKGTHAAARGGARSSGPLAAHASRGLRSLRPWVDRSIYCQLDAEGRLSRTWRQMDHMRRTFADTSRALSRRGSDCCKSPPPPRTSYCCHEMEQDGRGMNGWWRRSRSPSSTQRGGPGGLQPSRVGVGARGDPVALSKFFAHVTAHVRPAPYNGPPIRHPCPTGLMKGWRLHCVLTSYAIAARRQPALVRREHAPEPRHDTVAAAGRYIPRDDCRQISPPRHVRVPREAPLGPRARALA